LTPSPVESLIAARVGTRFRGNTMTTRLLAAAAFAAAHLLAACSGGEEATTAAGTLAAEDSAAPAAATATADAAEPTGAPIAASEIKPRRAGLWRTETVTRGEGMEDERDTQEDCFAPGEPVDLDMSDYTGPSCQNSVRRTLGGGYYVEGRCSKGVMNSHIVMRISDEQADAQINLTTGDNRKMSVTSQSRYVGACPAGSEPE